MTLVWKATKRLLPVTLLLVFVVVNCVMHKGEFTVIIENESAFTLMEVELIGDGTWTEQVPNIPAGKRVIVLAKHVFEEPGFGIRFVAAGAEITTGDMTFLVPGEGINIVTLIVEEDLDVYSINYQED